MVITFCAFIMCLLLALLGLRLDFLLLLQELMTRHKSTVAEFLTKNYDWVSHILIIRKCSYIDYHLSCICVPPVVKKLTDVLDDELCYR